MWWVISFECNNCFILIFKVDTLIFIDIIKYLYWVFPLLTIFRMSTVPFNTNNSMISLVSSRLSPFYVVIVSQRAQRKEKEMKNGKPNSPVNSRPLAEEPD